MNDGAKRYRILVCRGPECGERRGSSAIHEACVRELRGLRLEGRVELGWQSCFGRCSMGPNVQVRPLAANEPRFTLAMLPPGAGSVLYNGVTPGHVRRILEEHIQGGRVLRDLIHRPVAAPVSQPVSAVAPVPLAVPATPSSTSSEPAVTPADSAWHPIAPKGDPK